MRCTRLENKSVAEFYHEYCAMLHALGVDVRMHAAPNEMPDATPFAQDTTHATYDGDAAHRWWRALCSADRALKAFRSGFVGKVQPVALLVGRLRSRVHALFRPPRAATRRRNSQLPRLRDARGVFARVHQCWILARVCRLAGVGRRVLRVRVSGTDWLRHRAHRSVAGVL